jgi:hypothetical protein
MTHADLRSSAIRGAIAEIDTTVVEKVSGGDINNHGVEIGAMGHKHRQLQHAGSLGKHRGPEGVELVDHAALREVFD